MTPQLIHSALGGACTPGGGIADPNHPIYALMWLLGAACHA